MISLLSMKQQQEQIYNNDNTHKSSYHTINYHVGIATAASMHMYAQVPYEHLNDGFYAETSDCHESISYRDVKIIILNFIKV
jgi:hypothetical protein